LLLPGFRCVALFNAWIAVEFCEAKLFKLFIVGNSKKGQPMLLTKSSL